MCGLGGALKHPQFILYTINSIKGRFKDTQVVTAVDFNRQDVLWGGEKVSNQRLGEVELIINLINGAGLISLLKRSSITKRRAAGESTIDLMLVVEKLAESYLFCKIHKTHHGSDHYAIEAAFDVAIPACTEVERLLIKEAP